jgi:3-hydroxy-9,10-secoandrosta-1,3,5(10)-triene-9,17-dione monooxygenase reductase component
MSAEITDRTVIDPTRLREVLGRFATGVVIVTASTPEGPVGMAVNSFASVSLDPPLVLFCAGKSSTTWPDIEHAGAFSVSILGHEEQALCQQFASREGRRFDGVEHRPGSTGAPVLERAIAHLDCEIEAQHDAGDHVIVVGRVHDLDARGDGGPLVFFEGRFGELSA